MRYLAALLIFFGAFLPTAYAGSACSSLTSTINAYWKLDESSGNAADSVNSNTLTNTNTITYAAGMINNGASFASASSQYFTRASTASLNANLTDDRSWSFWIKPGSPVGSTADPVLIAKFQNTGQFGYYIQWNSSTNQIVFVNSNDGTATGSATVTIGAMSAGTWYHIVVVFVASTGTITVYQNGTSQGSASGTLKTGIFAGTDPFEVGRYSPGASNYVNGMMDELGFWSCSLSSSQVTSLYNSGAGLQYPFSVSSGAAPSIVGLVRGFVWPG